MYKISSYLSNVIKLISLIVLIFISFITLKMDAFVTFDWQETVHYAANSKIMYLKFLSLLILLLIIFPALKRISNNKFFYLCISIFFILGLYLVFNADTYLRPSDQGVVIDIAKKFNMGDYSDLTKKYSYVYYYPYQLGLIMFEQILLHFSNSITFFYFVGLVFNSLTITLLWLISREIFFEDYYINLTVFLASSFTPFLFNTLFIYGNVYGYTFLLCAVYFGIKVIKSDYIREEILYSVLMLAFILLSYTLKSSYEIALIAIAIVFILKSFKKKRFLIIAISVILCVPLSKFSVNYIYTIKSGNKVDIKGIPMLVYPVMGIQGSFDRAGRYIGYNPSVYKKNKGDREKTIRVLKKDLKKQLVYLKNNKEYTRKFFYYKELSLWADPMFQSVWNGPITSWGGKAKTNLMKKFYDNRKNKVYKYTWEYSEIILWIILIFSTFSIFLSLYKDSIGEYNFYLLFSILFLIGGFIFYIFWEAKSQFTWQYVSTLIPVASKGLGIILERICLKMKSGNLFSAIKTAIHNNFFNDKKSAGK